MRSAALCASIAEELFLFRDSGASADAPLSHFHERGRSGKLHLIFFLCEKGVQESPQTFLNPEIKKISSSEYAQSNAERIFDRCTVG